MTIENFDSLSLTRSESVLTPVMRNCAMSPRAGSCLALLRDGSVPCAARVRYYACDCEWMGGLDGIPPCDTGLDDPIYSPLARKVTRRNVE